MAARRRRRRARRVHPAWVLLGLGLAVVVAWLALRLLMPQAASAGAGHTTAETLPNERGSSTEPPATEASSESETEWTAETAPEIARSPVDSPIDLGSSRSRIALVIDDLGRDLGDIDRVEALGVPWTAAVLPFETQTPAVVSELNRRGIEYLCHLPMQPGSGNPGPGALTLEMSGPELAQRTREALAAVPGAVGVNNHMGSALSADREAMRSILVELERQGLFFVDSRTSAQSLGYTLARQLGIAATERQVFLDADPSDTGIAGQMARLERVASDRGAALAIGHPREATFLALERAVPRLVAAGFEFVPASYLLERHEELSQE